MNARELAKALDGREYLQEITDDECRQAKDANLLVVSGASDDLAELYGFTRDEVACYDGGTFYIDRKGLAPTWPEDEERGYEEAKEYFDRVNMPRITVTAVWCRSDDDPAWTYKVDAPVERFNIMEDGDVYCEGVVIDCSRLL